MVTHRRVARHNSQDSRHGNHKSEGVVCKTAEMLEQGTLVGSNPTSPTSYNRIKLNSVPNLLGGVQLNKMEDKNGNVL